jgi:thiol-disulfide isomerase/thioredoxin
MFALLCEYNQCSKIMLKKYIFLISIFISSSAFAASIKEFVHQTPVPTKTIEFIDDQKVIHNLNDYSGKVVLLNFWATWCVPCVNEMPQFAKLQQSLEGRSDIIFIPVSIDYEGAEAVKKFYSKYELTNLPVFVDSKGRSFTGAGLKALPTTLVINKNGQETARILGEIDWAGKDVRDYLTELAKE